MFGFGKNKGKPSMLEEANGPEAYKKLEEVRSARAESAVAAAAVRGALEEYSGEHPVVTSEQQKSDIEHIRAFGEVPPSQEVADFAGEQGESPTTETHIPVTDESEEATITVNRGDA